jgi:LPXTG-site transpeptidase (sortase) family protein
MSRFPSSIGQWLSRFPISPRRLLLVGMPILAVVVFGLVLGLRIVGGSGDNNEPAQVAGTPTAHSAGLLQNTIDQQLASEDLKNRQSQDGVSGTNPDAPVPGAEGDRLLIPSIGVDAPLTMSVATAGDNGSVKMANPSGPQDVVWYDFSAFPGYGGRPGVGGNTVLSGHVDYHDYGPAVFWDLQKLDPGAEIVIHLRDGTEYHYAVKWNKTVDPGSTVWSDVVAATSQESLTMITCAGTFDSSSRSYDQRRIVWAVRTS